MTIPFSHIVLQNLLKQEISGLERERESRVWESDSLRLNGTVVKTEFGILTAHCMQRLRNVIFDNKGCNENY